MSQAGTISSDGGGTDVQTLTPDSGGAVSAVANNINVNGYTCGSSQNIETVNNAGNFYIEDRTFVSCYVVDPSSTKGERGTYQTIEAAMNAAVADGKAVYASSTAQIIVRQGDYTETFVAPAGNFEIVGVSENGQFFNDSSGSRIIGNLTLSNQSVIIFKNIYMNDVTASGITAQLVFHDCRCGDVTVNGTGAQIFAQSTRFDTLTIQELAEVYLEQCQCSIVSMSGTVPQLNAYYCTSLPITVADSSICYVYKSNNVTLAGVTNQNCYLIDCNTTGLTPISANATVYISGLTESAAGVTTSFFGASVTKRTQAVQQGNMLFRRAESNDITVDLGDYLVAVTSTGAARNVTLPNTGMLVGQSWVIKDEGGGAAANNITVKVLGSAYNIDGSATQTIASNYGAMIVYWSGSAYFIL